MLTTAREVIWLSAGMLLASFREEPLAQHALMRLLQIIGEAARCVSRDYRDRHPEIAWGNLIAWRNRLVHEYFRVRLRAVWRAASEEVPALVPLLTPLVTPEADPEE
jgi:uncharacterized protein with HEPN domain